MKKVFLLLSLCSSILILDSCVESTIGCLDPFSSNYDLSADDECDDDCCNYPSFTLSTQYLFGEETMDSSLYYTNDVDSYFKLRSFYLVLSEFGLDGDMGSYEIRSKLDNKTIPDDLLGLRFRNSSNSPGTIAIEDSIRVINFTLGLPDELDDPINPDLDYSVIEFLNDSMYYDLSANQFYKMIVDIEVDSVSNEEIQIGLTDLGDIFQSNVTAGTTRGNSMSIQLLIDFERLFSGVQFQDANVESEAKALFGQNIVSSIEVN